MLEKNSLLLESFMTVLKENMVDEYFYDEFEFTLDDFESDNAITVYHATPIESGKSILKYGFDTQFNGKNANAYGKGVYTTFSVNDSRRLLYDYGPMMLQCKLIGGFERFLIFDENIARKFYGENWQLIYQLKSFLPDNIADELWNQYGLNPSAYAYVAQKYKIRGAIYHWAGLIAVLVYDFTALVPYAYSMDRGDTFIKNDLEKYKERMLSATDMDYRFGNQYLKMYSPQAGYDTNGETVGYAIVQKKNGLFNYVNTTTRQEMLPFDCESLTPFDPDNGEFQMEYKGRIFMADFWSFYDENEGEWFPINEIDKHI